MKQHTYCSETGATECMTVRGRTHRHFTNQKSEDQSRGPTIAMDYHFMKMKSVMNVETMSRESVTCIAVKEDRHQNHMSSVALKKGFEEPWTIGRVAKFMDMLGYREITLKSKDSTCHHSVQKSCS